MSDAMFHSRACYRSYMDTALRRLADYERLYGPLPWERITQSSE